MSLDDLQAQLRGTLDQQFAALNQKYEDGIAEARRQAAADAEYDIAKRLAEARAEWEAQLGAALTSAREEVERTSALQLAQACDEWDVQLKTAIAAARDEAGRAGAAELGQARAEWEAHHQAGLRAALEEAERTAATQLGQARAEWDAQLQSAVSAARQQAEQTHAATLAQLQTDWEAKMQAATAIARADAERESMAAAERHRHEFEQARGEWEARLVSVVAAARAELEQQATAAALREREQHAQALTQAVDQAVANARRTAALELESERRRTQAQIDAAQLQATTEAAAAIEKAKHDHDEELQRTRSLSDAARAQAVAEVDGERQQLKAELAAERQRAAAAEAVRQQQETATHAERLRARVELDGLRQAMQNELTAARQAAGSEPGPRVPSGADALPGSPAAFTRVAAAIREIDGARSLSQALEFLLAHAAASAGRAAIFLINDDRLKAWKTAGIPEVDAQTVESSIAGKDLLARAIQAGHGMPSSAALPAPPFARLPPGRDGFAAPLMIGGRAVAVLYVDSGEQSPAAGALDAVETLVRHTSATVALRTAMRTLDVLGGGPANGGDTGIVSDAHGARRYARLLVSEIKLYNEAAVRDGRQQRDLLRRLRSEIDRAQRLYEERVLPALGSRHVYFEEELVQTLADGDAALLGRQ